jgi:cell division protein FtsL
MFERIDGAIIRVKNKLSFAKDDIAEKMKSNQKGDLVEKVLIIAISAFAILAIGAIVVAGMNNKTNQVNNAIQSNSLTNPH